MWQTLLRIVHTLIIIIGIQFKQSQLSALWSTLWASGLAALDKYLITLATELQF